jgi:uncharacterized oxidoreductase
MKTTGNTILITGGSAGIGFELARTLSENGNRVIITGRNTERMDKALVALSGVTGIVCDVTKIDDINKLAVKLTTDFPDLNMVINNAGQAYVNTLTSGNAAEKAGEEMLTNYLSIIRLNEKLLPILKSNTEAAIVNVSSIVAFVPNHTMATYGASKAALHSYSQSLRILLERTSEVKVFELMPPLVNTTFSTEIGGANGIPPHEVADAFLHALANDLFEIHVGRTADVYHLALSSPADALQAMNPVG